MSRTFGPRLQIYSAGAGFASVPYGAAGSTRIRTLEVTKWLEQEPEIKAIARLGCLGATADS